MSGIWRDKDGKVQIMPDAPEIVIDPKTKKPIIWNPKNNADIGIDLGCCKDVSCTFRFKNGKLECESISQNMMKETFHEDK